jgi:hypothetical protein
MISLLRDDFNRHEELDESRNNLALGRIRDLEIQNSHLHGRLATVAAVFAVAIPLLTTILIWLVGALHIIPVKP